VIFRNLRRSMEEPGSPSGSPVPPLPCDPFDRGISEDPCWPGSAGEHRMQRDLGTEERAQRFYSDQVLDHLNDRMREFISRQEMLFIATADRHGECDCSFRAGPPGFVAVIDERTLAYPEYRGNGVLASVGNIGENPHVALLMIDFFRDVIGLHVNGTARAVPADQFRIRGFPPAMDVVSSRRPTAWVEITVVEAYIHCSKHIPRLAKLPRQRSWGTDNPKRKGGDYFDAKDTPTPWSNPPK
jgi:uncharacterized protein